MTPDERKKIQDTLVRSTEQIVRQMKADAEAGHVDSLERSATKVSELTKQKDFPAQRSQEFLRAIKFIQMEAHEHRVSELLAELNHRLHDGDEEIKNEMLGKIRESVAAAVRFGADESFRTSVDRRVQVLQLTTADGIDKRAKAAAARKTELHDTVCKAPGGRERRRAIRYVDPVLTVEINGTKYKTLNWSTRGLLLEEFSEPLELGSFVKAFITSEDVPGGGRTWAMVVRRVPKQHELALEFPDISTLILALMHEMKLAGIRHEPG